MLAWTWPEMKKQSAVIITNDSSLRGAICVVYCVLVQGYKRDFKNQNIGDL